MQELILSTILIFADYGQTRYIATHSEYFETNIALGEHPSLRDINIYFSGVAAMNVGIRFILPPRKAKKVWYGISAFQGSVMKRNKSIGIGFNYDL